MKIAPFDRFSLLSPHDVERLVAKLERVSAPPQLFSFDRPNEPYVGTVHREGFKISPVISYRNSFKPVIVGRFRPRHSGVRIDVTQRLNVFVLGFMAIWLLVTFSVGLALITENPTSPDAAFGLGMFSFGWLLMTGGFWFEARHTKEDLMLRFDATDAEMF